MTPTARKSRRLCEFAISGATPTSLLVGRRCICDMACGTVRFNRTRAPDCRRELLEIIRTFADDHEDDVRTIVDTMCADAAEQAIEQGSVNGGEMAGSLIVGEREHPDYVQTATLLEHDHAVGGPSRRDRNFVGLLA